MEQKKDIIKKAEITLKRILAELEEKFFSGEGKGALEIFQYRLSRNFTPLFSLLYQLYGARYDFYYYLEKLLNLMTKIWLSRNELLKALDAAREANPGWFQSNQIIGATCYVDLFCEDLTGLKRSIPYLKELGITYLHLIPMFESPAKGNDGGYAVSNYRRIDPRLGTMEELGEIATEFRMHGISLVMDFVFNHTSDEHEWARKALKGEEEFQNYYRMFDDRTLPDQYERYLRPVFPDEHQGSFTYRPGIKKWIWTTFHNFQWDLNYENPEVFLAMAEEMLFLANIGVEVLRLDAVAFLWKKMGTSCENLPEAHSIIQAFNLVARIASPALLFKSEAIVHPDEVNRYISNAECQLSYNPQLMALLWNSLATRKVRLLRHGLKKRFTIPEECSWVNYIRCHDDIGWAFSNDDIRELNLDPAIHRKFINDFYTGRHQGSFARGLPFQEDSENLETRISGTMASLAGLELALEMGDEKEIDLAIRRIQLLYGIIFTIGGIPLIYLGDELSMLNNFDYKKDPDKEGDSRWVHRLPFDWNKAKDRNNLETFTGRVYLIIQRLIQIRKRNLAFSKANTEIIDTTNDHIFGYFRLYQDNTVLVLANFSETVQSIPGKQLRLLGMPRIFTDILSGQSTIAGEKLTLEPYQFMVLIGI